MTTEEIADLLNHHMRVTLVTLRLAGVEHVAVVDGRAKTWPAGTPLAVAQREAASLGAELLSFNETAAQVKIGEAVLRDALRLFESDIAAKVAAGAAKA
jgi:hypothetical protein